MHLNFARIVAFFLLSKTLEVNAANGNATLYPFGVLEGDTQAPTLDDDCSTTYSQGITMFGQNFSKIYVCTNGAISLDKKYKKHEPEKFPLRTANVALICPFWADVDLCRGGQLLTRETTDPTLLRRASLDVRDAYRLGTDATYNATWMMIATWYDVRAYNKQAASCPLKIPQASPGNTFQAVITSNGVETFVMFNYEKIEWFIGSAVRSKPAQVGFDSGDGVNFYATPDSQTSNIVNIATGGNSGIPGKMVFKLGAPGSNNTKIVLPDKPSPPTTTTPITTATPTTTTPITTTPTTTTMPTTITPTTITTTSPTITAMPTTTTPTPATPTTTTTTTPPTTTMPTTITPTTTTTTSPITTTMPTTTTPTTATPTTTMPTTTTPTTATPTTTTTTTPPTTTMPTTTAPTTAPTTTPTTTTQTTTTPTTATPITTTPTTTTPATTTPTTTTTTATSTTATPATITPTITMPTTTATSITTTTTTPTTTTTTPTTTTLTLPIPTTTTPATATSTKTTPITTTPTTTPTTKTVTQTSIPSSTALSARFTIHHRIGVSLSPSKTSNFQQIFVTLSERNEVRPDMTGVIVGACLGSLFVLLSLAVAMIFIKKSKDQTKVSNHGSNDVRRFSVIPD